MQDFGDWGLLSMWVSDTSFSLCSFVLPDFENIFQRFLYELQARHSYFCIPRNLRSIWCACTDKFYHVAVKHSLELCSFQKNLGRLMAHACINDTALPYYLQCFQKSLDLQHILCNTDLHMYSQLDLSRDVELPEHLQTARKTFAAAPLGFAVHP